LSQIAKLLIKRWAARYGGLRGLRVLVELDGFEIVPVVGIALVMVNTRLVGDEIAVLP
jgi:hypothetical protein